MESVQAKVLSRIEDLVTEYNTLEAVVSFDYANIGRVLVLDKVSLQAVASISFDFQNNSVKASVVPAGTSHASSTFRTFFYVKGTPGAPNRDLADLLAAVRETVDTVVRPV